MPGCLVPGCTSGYKSNWENVNFFTVPKDDELKKKWQYALKRPKALISKIQVVCDKHFLFRDIIRSRQLLSPDGKVVGVSPYQRPRLLPGAVPSLFPWTEVIPSNDNSKNSVEAIALEVGHIIEKITPKDLVVGKFSEQNNTLESERREASESTQVCSRTEREENIRNNLQDLKANDDCTASKVFNFECLLTSTIQLPISWMRNNITHKDEPLISFFFLRCDMVDGKYSSYILKEVIVDSTLQLHTHVLQKFLIDSPYINVKKSIRSVTELEEYLRQINTLQVCHGIVIPDICEDEKSDALYTDIRNVFRRKTCTLLCHSSQCNSCQNAKRALVRKRKRHEISLQDLTSLDKKSFSISNTVNSGNTHMRKLKQKLSRSIEQKKKLRLENKKLRRHLKT